MTEDYKQGYRDGLIEAHRLAADLQGKICDRHLATPSFLGFPSKAHHRLLGGSRAIKELGNTLYHLIIKGKQS